MNRPLSTSLLFCFSLLSFGANAADAPHVKTPDLLQKCGEELEETIAIHVEMARPEDAPQLAALDVEAWGGAMAASPQKLISRMKIYPKGQLVVRVGERVLGFINSQKMAGPIHYQDPTLTWPQVTGHGFIDETHVPDGNTLFLINLTVDPGLKGSGISRTDVGAMLVDEIIEQAGREGISRIEGITRLNGMRAELGQSHPPSLSQVQDYLQRVHSKQIRDPALTFHLKQGARVIGPIQEAMPDDDDSWNWGALIVYEIFPWKPAPPSRPW